MLPAPHPAPLTPRLLAFGVVAVLLGVAADRPLFDGAKVQFFPFARQWELLREIVANGLPSPRL